MPRYSVFVIAVLLVSFPDLTSAQGPTVETAPGPGRIVLDDDREIALARSAAPPAVSADATVLVYRPGVGYEVGTRGSNGVTCLVDRSRVDSLEPHCYDAEGGETILRVRLREAELRERGLDEDAIRAEVDRAIRSGELRLPSRPAMTYMMSAGQVLVSDDGRNVGTWKPHLMIYVPYITADQLGLSGDPSTRAAMVVDGGSALANILIVVEGFVDPSEFEGDG